MFDRFGTVALLSSGFRAKFVCCLDWCFSSVLVCAVSRIVSGWAKLCVGPQSFRLLSSKLLVHMFVSALRLFSSVCHT